MQTPDFYCDECGAANLPGTRFCFACHSQFKVISPSSSSLVGELPEEKQAPPALLQFQFDLSSGTLTMVRALLPEPDLLYGRYEILSKAGTGGFGAVYKARDRRNRDRLVAIKAIELSTLSAARAIEATDTFNRELSLLSNLDHPHLPQVYEHFIDATHWYLVMDFIDGEPLDEYLEQLDEPALALSEVIDIGLQLCEVLRYLHQLKPPIIFRDVKPGNIMRTPGGHLYLIDFGIARRFRPGQARDTTPLGSPGFAAPEQYGKAQTTVRSDIYGLGATLYFLLTRYDPATTPFHLPPLASLCPSLPEALVNLITSMLSLDPQARPDSIATVQQTLRNYVSFSEYAPSVTLPSSPVSLLAPVPARSHWLNRLVKRFFSATLVALLPGLALTGENGI